MNKGSAGECLPKDWSSPAPPTKKNQASRADSCALSEEIDGRKSHFRSENFPFEPPDSREKRVASEIFFSETERQNPNMQTPAAPLFMRVGGRNTARGKGSIFGAVFRILKFFRGKLLTSARFVLLSPSLAATTAARAEVLTEPRKRHLPKPSGAASGRLDRKKRKKLSKNG